MIAIEEQVLNKYQALNVEKVSYSRLNIYYFFSKKSGNNLMLISFSNTSLEETVLKEIKAKKIKVLESSKTNNYIVIDNTSNFSNNDFNLNFYKGLFSTTLAVNTTFKSKTSFSTNKLSFVEKVETILDNLNATTDYHLINKVRELFSKCLPIIKNEEEQLEKMYCFSNINKNNVIYYSDNIVILKDATFCYLPFSIYILSSIKDASLEIKSSIKKTVFYLDYVEKANLSPLFRQYVSFYFSVKEYLNFDLSDKKRSIIIKNSLNRNLKFLEKNLNINCY